MFAEGLPDSMKGCVEGLDGIDGEWLALTAHALGTLFQQRHNGVTAFERGCAEFYSIIRLILLDLTT